MIIFAIVFVLFLWADPVHATDWRLILSQVSIASPYDTFGFVNPIHAVVPVSLFAALPAGVSLAAVSALTFTLAIMLAYRFRASGFEILMILLSAPFLSALANGAIEWLMLAALLVPRRYGLILMAGKPQSGMLMALSWLRRRPALGLPFAGFTLASLLVWPWWPADMLAGIVRLQALGAGDMLKDDHSAFPWLIPIGLALLWLGWKNPQKDDQLFLLASFCFMPYYLIHSMLALQVCLLKEKALFYGLWLAGWGVVIIKGLL